MRHQTSNNLKFKIAWVLFLYSICFLGVVKYFTRSLVQQRFKRGAELSEKGLEYGNQSHLICKSPTINEFPRDFVPFEESLPYARLGVHVFILLYFLYGISIVCDEYFVDSLEKISKDLKLKEDVAGATFMAGTSAPELFTSIIGVIFAKSDIGTGTIVGSAIFNVFFIISICGLASNIDAKINYYPVTRDCLFYGLSVAALLIVLYDGEILWYESIVLILLYLVYIVIMYFNNDIELMLKKKEIQSSQNVQGIEPGYAVSMEAINEARKSQDNRETKEEENEDEEVKKPFDPFKAPEKLHSKVIWILGFPINVLIYFTVPDTRRERFSKFPFYFITFLISTAYIGVFTYGLVWMVVIICDKISVPDTVAGLTFLAAGTSLPEVVSSILIARRGKGGMAISNSIGSNVFDILICLGLPWFIEGVILKPMVPIQIYSGGIFYSSAVLFTSIFILLVSFVLNKWVLSKKFGIVLFIFWCLVTTLTCLFEYDIFGKFSIPYC